VGAILHVILRETSVLLEKGLFVAMTWDNERAAGRKQLLLLARLFSGACRLIFVIGVNIILDWLVTIRCAAAVMLLCSASGEMLLSRVALTQGPCHLSTGSCLGVQCISVAFSFEVVHPLFDDRKRAVQEEGQAR
jgi:hypothetical protein